MGLIDRRRWSERIERRVDDVRWRARYWWLDTAEGARAHVVVFVLAALLLAYQLGKMALAAVLPQLQPVAVPQQAVVWWVVQLVIAVVAAALSYALRPKPQKAPEQEFQGPTVEDGVCVDDRFGEAWINDEHILAWKIVGTRKITQRGKK